MSEAELDSVHYAILANRIRAIQKRWNRRASAAAARGQPTAASRIRELSPCGQLVRLVRQTVENDDDGSYVAIGSVLREYQNYNLSFASVRDKVNYDNPVQIEKRVTYILNEARRGNGKGYQEALIQYLWEHKRWRPERVLSTRRLKAIGSAIDPFLDTHIADSPPVRAYFRPEIVVTDLNSAAWAKALQLIGKEAKQRSGILDFSFLSIDCLPYEISQFYWLREMICPLTAITSLAELETCTNLIRLDIGWTGVSISDQLQFCPYLTSLACYEMHLRSLKGVEKCQYLRRLDCSSNPIVNLQWLEHCGALSALNCSETNISSLDQLSSCFSLRSLNVSNTEIVTFFDLESCQSLEWLNCSQNKLGSLRGFGNIGQLKHLVCDEAGIITTSGIESLLQLKSLTLKYNPLTDLSGIEYCNCLSVLDVTDTEVVSVDAILNCTSLETLILERTPITSISGVQRLTNLREIHLPRGIEDITPLRELPNLQRVKLDCKLTASDSDWLSRLANFQVV